MEDRIGLRGGLDAMEKEKYLDPAGNRTQVVQLVDCSLYKLNYPSSYKLSVY
jgi:hypothetical protein